MSDSNPKIQSRAESIFAEQIKLLVNGLPFALVTVVFISILVVFILRAEVNVIYLAVWLGLNFILSFVRLIITRSYKNKSYPPEELKRFSRLFFMGTLLSGILWGALPLALLPESFTLQVFIALVLGGMSVGATSSLSAIHKYYMAFTLPCLLPLGIRFIWMGTEMYMVIGIMNIVFVLMMILLSLRLNKNILETLNLRFEKDLLIADFMEAREQSEILNEELENEVIEKEQVATELEHTTEQLSLLLNALPIVPYVSKAYGDYGAVYISDNVKNITGFDAEEFLNDSGFWGSRIHPDDRDQVFANLPKLFERGEHHHEYRWMVSDGTYRWFYDSLKLVKTGGEKATNLIGAWLDITDRKRVEQELHDQLKFIHVLMDTIPTPIYFKDPDGIYIGCNQGFEELIGRGRNDIIGQTDEALAPKELASQYYASDWALYRHAKQNIHESVILAADKVERNVIFHKAVFRKSDNSIGGIVGTILDITEQKEHENKLQKALYELKRTQDQLIESEKMASLGEMIGGITHEINNPVNFIHTSLPSLKSMLSELFGLLEQYSRLDDNREEAEMMIKSIKEKLDINETMSDIKELLDVITEGAFRTSKIVKDMRHFSRTSSESWELADIHKSIDSSLSLLHNQYKNRIDIEKEYDGQGEIQCISGQIDQVLLNVLANSVQSIKEKGTISIKTYTKQSKLHIIISDTGVGIPKEHLARIFNPFFTTKEVGKGTGLGLSISYEIIKRHHGTISAKSKPGEGSQFQIILPTSQI